MSVVWLALRLGLGYRDLIGLAVVVTGHDASHVSFRCQWCGWRCGLGWAT